MTDATEAAKRIVAIHESMFEKGHTKATSPMAGDCLEVARTYLHETALVVDLRWQRDQFQAAAYDQKARADKAEAAVAELVAALEDVLHPHDCMTDKAILDLIAKHKKVA